MKNLTAVLISALGFVSVLTAAYVVLKILAGKERSDDVNFSEIGLF